MIILLLGVILFYVDTTKCHAKRDQQVSFNLNQQGLDREVNRVYEVSGGDKIRVSDSGRYIWVDHTIGVLQWM